MDQAPEGGVFTIYCLTVLQFSHLFPWWSLITLLKQALQSTLIDIIILPPRVRLRWFPETSPWMQRPFLVCLQSMPTSLTPTRVWRYNMQLYCIAQGEIAAFSHPTTFPSPFLFSVCALHHFLSCQCRFAVFMFLIITFVMIIKYLEVDDLFWFSSFFFLSSILSLSFSLSLSRSLFLSSLSFFLFLSFSFYLFLSISFSINLSMPRTLFPSVFASFYLYLPLNLFIFLLYIAPHHRGASTKYSSCASFPRPDLFGWLYLLRHVYLSKHLLQYWRLCVRACTKCRPSDPSNWENVDRWEWQSIHAW